MLCRRTTSKELHISHIFPGVSKGFLHHFHIWNRFGKKLKGERAIGCVILCAKFLETYSNQFAFDESF